MHGIGRTVVSVSLYVCLHFKVASGINTKVGRYIARGRPSACIDPEIEGWKVRPLSFTLLLHLLYFVFFWCTVAPFIWCAKCIVGDWCYRSWHCTLHHMASMMLWAKSFVIGSANAVYSSSSLKRLSYSIWSGQHIRAWGTICYVVHLAFCITTR